MVKSAPGNADRIGPPGMKPDHAAFNTTGIPHGLSQQGDIRGDLIVNFRTGIPSHRVENINDLRPALIVESVI
jgi:hypothetical protein